MVLILAARSVNLPLWCGGAKTNLWASVPVWFSCLCIFGSDRTVWTHSRRCSDLLGAIAGHDPKTQLVKVDIPDYTQSLKPDLKSIRIGVIKETFGEGLDEVVEQAVNQAIEQLKNGAGFKKFPAPLPQLAHILHYRSLRSSKLGSLRRR